MDDVVVDASVFVSRLLREDVHHASTLRWFETRARDGGLVVVPAIMPAEVAGAITRRIHDGEFARVAVERILRLPELRVVTIDRRLGERAADLAAELELRGADATYVAVAQHLELPLVTRDREQRERAGRRSRPRPRPPRRPSGKVRDRRASAQGSRPGLTPPRRRAMQES